MREEKQFNPLSGFDFRALDDPQFLEDAVREEIITPILKGLGYSIVGPNRIVRSKKLVHPFVTIGSKTRRVELIPDYLLEVDTKCAWVLEAKAPVEDITNQKHLDQTYTYAIHNEIRVPYFALCNGRQFTLYHVSRPKPIFDCPIIGLPNAWANLRQLLPPENVMKYHHSLANDFGFHLKRLKFDEFESLVFPDVPIVYICKYSEELFTFASGVRPAGGADYCVSFDFNASVFEQLEGSIPSNVMQLLRKPTNEGPTVVRFADAIYRVDVDCKVGQTIHENEDEIFLPLWINRILNLERKV